MTRTEKQALAAKLREVIDRLRTRSKHAETRAKEYQASAPPGVAALVGWHPMAYGHMEAGVEADAAEIEALVHVHLDRKGVRR